jgi:hypothetical protein
MHITDKTSKDKFKKQATYPKGDYSSRNTGTTQVENGQKEETKSTTEHVYTTIILC